MIFSKKVWVLLIVSLLLIAFPVHVWAQDGSSGDSTLPAGSTMVNAAATLEPAATAETPKGVITGKIVNKNDAAKPAGDLEVMLHVLDKDQNELGMLHGKSIQDGSYQIADVPFQEGIGYVAAVVYEGTTYYSLFAAAEAGKTSLGIDIPVYESTTDLSNVQVGQMHVLFSFASDGMDVKQLYALSNLGDRTVRDSVEIPGKNGAKATISFPLPAKADFINFQPNDETRFVKIPGGFFDTASIIPGEMSSQIVVGYLVPYTTPLTYQLKTVLPVKAVNFVVPKESGVKLKGAGLGEPEPVTSQDGQLFYLYKLENLPAGKTLDLSFEGKPVIPKSQTTTNAAASSTNLPNQKPLFLGLGILGVALIGGGAFWWVRSSRDEEVVDEEIDEADILNADQKDQAFEQTLTEIAQLDQRFEQGELIEATYREQRALLMAQAAQAMPAAQSSPTKDLQTEAGYSATDAGELREPIEK